MVAGAVAAGVGELDDVARVSRRSEIFLN